jgi:hypothetical protein
LSGAHGGCKLVRNGPTGRTDVHAVSWRRSTGPSDCTLRRLRMIREFRPDWPHAPLQVPATPVPNRWKQPSAGWSTLDYVATTKRLRVSPLAKVHTDEYVTSVVTRVEKRFETRCNRCAHTWSVHQEELQDLSQGDVGPNAVEVVTVPCPNCRQPKRFTLSAAERGTGRSDS